VLIESATGGPAQAAEPIMARSKTAPMLHKDKID